MKKGRNFKKILGVMALLGIAAPSTLAVVACKEKHFINILEEHSALVVHFINKSNYSQQVAMNSSIENLKKSINASFIRSKLSAEISKHFQNSLFTLIKITNEKGGDILVSDLQLPGTINAKIIYNYGSVTNQETRLKISISEERILLEEVFKDFKFNDDKGVVDFLDANNLDLITKQIETFLGKSLEEVGLILENQQATSIQLVAANDSKNYRGKVTLKWNLKLLEIWTSDSFLRDGMLGYFYWKKDTNVIKYIDIYGLKSGTNRIIHKEASGYHLIRFNSSHIKWFGFRGEWRTDEVEEKFGSFELQANGLVIDIANETPDPSEIKYFYNNKWSDFKEFPKPILKFNELGQL